MQHERYPSSASVYVTGFGLHCDPYRGRCERGGRFLGCRYAQPQANGCNPYGIKTT